jgi:hypothetical protein
LTPEIESLENCTSSGHSCSKVWETWDLAWFQDVCGRDGETTSTKFSEPLLLSFPWQLLQESTSKELALHRLDEWKSGLIEVICLASENESRNPAVLTSVPADLVGSNY